MLDLYQSSVGKKVMMALSGAVLFGFVIGHLAGNLKVFQGAAKFDAYARFLREVGAPVFGSGQLLWLARGGLLLALALHLVAAIQLTRVSRAARSVGYRQHRDLSFSYASRTMRWGGVIVLAFVLYHLLHLTFGTVHGSFSHESAYHNVVTGFRIWPVSVAYVAAMVPLGLHVYHGLWSATQTLDLAGPTIRACRRPLAGAVALFVVLGNVSIPLAVMAGLVR